LSTAAGNILLALLLVAEVVRAVLLARDDPPALIFAAAAFMLTWLVLRRPEPSARDASAGALLAAAAAGVWPLLLARMAPDSGPPPLWAVCIQIAAMLLMAASIAALGRNFAVLPQYRGLAIKGPYCLVRHPLYASYLLYDAVTAVEAGAAAAFLLWLAEAGILLIRIRFEERLLVKHASGYAQYMSRVRHRLVPYLI
jgi:protein-S-isoprenylcysteine O-methyltransferase Ste14